MIAAYLTSVQNIWPKPMLLEPSNQTGAALGDAGADASERAAHALPVRIHGAMSRCLRQLQRRLRWAPELEARRFSLRYDTPGPWILNGARCGSCVRFRDLAAALAFARDDSGAGEADIEFWVDGLYIFVHQKRGWPHRLCAPAGTARP